MLHEIGPALVLFLIGAAICMVTVRRLRSGTSYISKPPMRVLRRDDPFSFWLSLIPFLLVSAIFLGAGLFMAFSLLAEALALVPRP